MKTQINELVIPDSEDETNTTSNILLEQMIHKRPEINLLKPNSPLESYLDCIFTPAMTGGVVTLFHHVAFSTASTSHVIPVVDHAARARRVNDILRPARDSLTRFSNTSLVRRAVGILDELYNVLMKYDVKKYKSLMAFESEDCIALEWIYPHWRVGFAFDQDPKDDSWYLLSDDTAGDINASGNSILEDIDWIIYWLIKKL